MDFGSLEEAIAYIEQAIPDALYDVSFDMRDIMVEEIMDQIYRKNNPIEYKRTGQLMESPGLVDINPTSITMEFQDNGDWRDALGSKGHAFPLEKFEEGKVWGVGTNSDKSIFNYLPATNIMDESVNKCEQEIPDKFRAFLQSKGIPIE